jgi:hypothetical protein
VNKTTKEENSAWIWGIFDGHSCLGDLAATACCDSFQKNFSNVSNEINMIQNDEIDELD